MKKLLSKLIKTIKSGGIDAPEGSQSKTLDEAQFAPKANPLVIDKNGLQIIITHDNVEPELLSSEVVRILDKGFGIEVGPFINGVAEVSWKLKPYKYYEIDYGVPGWEHDCIAYAMINETGKFLEKFQFTDYYGLKALRTKAEKENKTHRE